MPIVTVYVLWKVLLSIANWSIDCETHKTANISLCVWVCVFTYRSVYLILYCRTFWSGVDNQYWLVAGSRDFITSNGTIYTFPVCYIVPHSIDIYPRSHTYKILSHIVTSNSQAPGIIVNVRMFQMFVFNNTSTYTYIRFWISYTPSCRLIEFLDPLQIFHFH